MTQSKSHASVIQVVSAHWGNSASLSPRVLIADALRRVGEDPARLQLETTSLGRLDEFHCLGVEATDDLARLLGIDRQAGARILDVGCGLGGPARRLASVYGCDVVCLDITEPFLQVAQEVSEAMGLAGRIRFLHGDACAYSAVGELFDIAWMQVTAANIDDRQSLYGSLHRALNPRGLLGVYDIFQTPGAVLRYPVPWSEIGEGSALLSEEETIAEMANAGFNCIHRQDVTLRALGWFENQWKEADMEIRGLIPPRIGFSILLPKWREIAYNQAHNLRSGAIRFGYLVAAKV